MPEAILFVVASAGLLYLSRASLAAVGSHGFYRFFAWEALLGLFALNVRWWFVEPFAPRQLAAWLLLVLSLGLALAGFVQLHRQGRATAARGDAALYAFEKTTALVTTGLYRYIRHPLYSSLLWLGWGIWLKSPSWPAGLLAFAASALLYAAAAAEEAENLRYFGAAYADYARRSKRFIPFVF